MINSRILCAMVAMATMMTGFVSCAPKQNEGPEMKVIVADDGTVGRYIDEDDTSYRGEIQDEYQIDKANAHTEIVKAADGKGILTLQEPGQEQVYASADTGSEVVGTLVHEEGCIPETYNCLGYKNGWFKVEVNDKIGYVQESSVNWDAVNSF